MIIYPPSLSPLADPNLASIIERQAPMSRSSFASFHLTGLKPSSGKMMTSSVDRLFDSDGDVFISSNYNDFNQVLPSIQETASVQSKSPEPSTVNKSSTQLSDSSAGRESPSTAASTAKSSRRDSLSDKVVIPTQSQLQQQQVGKLQQNQSSESSISSPVPAREYGKAIAFEIPRGGGASGSSSNR